MAFRFFPTRAVAWLLVELAKLEEELAKGKTITDASAGDASSRQEVQIGITQRMGMIKHDLCILDPITYPPDDYIGDTTTTYGSP
jgi:hypothetical protein